MDYQNVASSENAAFRILPTTIFLLTLMAFVQHFGGNEISCVIPTGYELVSLAYVYLFN